MEDQRETTPPPPAPQVPVSALPDITSTPPNAQKAKLEIQTPIEESNHAVIETNGVGTPTVTAVPLPADEVAAGPEEWWELKMTWGGKVFEVKVGGSDMVYDFKAQIQDLTQVPPENQKLIGLTTKVLSAEYDAKRFGTLKVKKGAKFKLVGTPVEDRFRDPTAAELNQVFDDFDVRYPDHPERGNVAAIAPADDPRNKRKIQEIVQKIPITVMNEPRPGKKLLVLDLDYTIADTKPLLAGSLPAEECARPGLNAFLEEMYEHYEIVVWSQTHWRWLESKLVELGMLGGQGNYKVCFVSDRTTMFPVFTMRNGQAYKHEVKPLAYFWSNFPQWSAKNISLSSTSTVHLDDLSRNFALNAQSGLKVKAYTSAGTQAGMEDRELPNVGAYLKHLAENVEDYTTVDHGNWRNVSKRLRRRSPPPLPPTEQPPHPPQPPA